MDCRSFLDRLEALLDETLGGDARRAVEEHLRECADCRQLLELARSEPDGAAVEPPADLAGSILERTSGPACNGARDRLCDYVDGALPEIDAELVRLHLDGCESCEGLALALTSLTAELPAMAEIEPDAAFVDDVLARTVPWRKRLARRLEKLSAVRELWPRVVNRPRFALEAAYVGTMVVVLIFGPNLPLAGVPRRAIDLVRARPLVESGEARGRIAEVEDRVVSGTRTLWEATGGEVAASSRTVAADLTQRYERTRPARYDLRLRADELVDAALDVDPRAVGTVIRGIGSDLGTLWKHLASNESEETDNPVRR
jgi:predicted anti-sigma-YlaC factor YlaD